MVLEGAELRGWEQGSVGEWRCAGMAWRGLENR